jgi:hypothetical protein
MIPYEIIYKIYDFADMETRININKAFNISFTVANPLLNNIESKPSTRYIYTSTRYTSSRYSPFNFIMRGH